MLEVTTDIVEILVGREAVCLRGIGYTRHRSYIEEERNLLPALDTLFNEKLVYIKVYEEGNYPEYRFELSDAGRTYYESIPVVQRLRVLVLYLKFSNDHDDLFLAFMDYMNQLSLEELPEFLSHGNSTVREFAKKRFDKLSRR